jgi:seryl-tRNA synthetase
MIDLEKLRENPAQFSELLQRRGNYDLQPIIDRDRQIRDLITQRSQLQARSNQISKTIGDKMKGGGETPRS